MEITETTHDEVIDFIRNELHESIELEVYDLNNTEFEDIQELNEDSTASELVANIDRDTIPLRIVIDEFIEGEVEVGERFKVPLNFTGATFDYSQIGDYEDEEHQYTLIYIVEEADDANLVLSYTEYEEDNGNE